MTATTLSRNGNGAVTAAPDLREHRNGNLQPADPVEPAPGILEKNGQAYHAVLPRVTEPESLRPADIAGKHVLALFCYEPPTSPLGRHVEQLAAALGRRKTTVYLFSPHAFDIDDPNVHVLTLGETEGSLLEKVRDFSSEACNVFLRLFPDAPRNVTLMGYEWSGAGPLSMLHGLKNHRTIFALHSLERQRSDMSQEISLRIEEVELAALRESTSILLQEQATGEVAKFWVPECSRRLEYARQMFPVHRFQRELDAGAVKSRFQVGPVDPTIVFLGDHSDQYGPDLLIKAMPAVLRNHPQARLISVGFGETYWPMRVYTRYLLLEHAIRLPGNVEGQALDELLQSADVIAVPSRSSTPWWPILAGWAAGKPVVATHEAAPQLLEHERDSVLCYPSENSLVWGIERVLFDPEFAQKIAEAGREKLEQRFGWNTLAEQVEALMGVPAK